MNFYRTVQILKYPICNFACSKANRHLRFSSSSKTTLHSYYHINFLDGGCVVRTTTGTRRIRRASEYGVYGRFFRKASFRSSALLRGRPLVASFGWNPGDSMGWAKASIKEGDGDGDARVDDQRVKLTFPERARGAEVGLGRHDRMILPSNLPSKKEADDAISFRAFLSRRLCPCHFLT